MAKKRVLIAHPYVTPSGGGNAVAAWALQALRDEFDLTLATLGSVNHDALNSNFGTSLRKSDFRILVAPGRYQKFLRRMPTPSALLRISLTMRWAQNVDRDLGRFDVLFSTENEADFGRRGLQYVHFPWVYTPRPEVEMRWFHLIPGVLWGYRVACQNLGRATNQGLSRNLTLANSRWVAEKVLETHGIDSIVLHPPIPGSFPDVSWESRRLEMVGVGRIHIAKRWQLAVDIVDRVREAGSPLTLTIIGHRDDVEYGARLAELALSRPWFRVLNDVTREELTAYLSQCRYGIHAMENEHFGIAPAELQRAGCVTFAHNSGGPIEILGGDQRLLFEDAEDGAAKVSRAITDAQLSAELQRQTAVRRDLFSTTRFCETLRNIVRDF